MRIQPVGRLIGPVEMQKHEAMLPGQGQGQLSLGPVSYTHLDVYKRQGENIDRRPSIEKSPHHLPGHLLVGHADLPGRHPVVPGAGDHGLVFQDGLYLAGNPVSYTHLWFHQLGREALHQ